MPDTDAETVYRTEENIIKRDIAGATLLVPIVGDLADMRCLFSLNPVGVFIWDNLNDTASVRELSMAVSQNFDVPEETAVTDTIEFLALLESERLIARV